MAALNDAREFAKSVSLTPKEAERHGLALNKDGQRRTAFELLSYPNIALADLAKIWPRFGALAPKVAEQIEIDAKYAVYLSRQAADVAAYRRDESFALPDDLDYAAHARAFQRGEAEAAAHRPRTIGQAGKIDGITPAALTLLVAHVKRGQRKPRNALETKRAGRVSISKPTNSARSRSRLFHVKRKSGWTNSSSCCCSGSSKLNLVASSTIPQYLDAPHRRLAPALALAPDAKVWVDFGSGGGFPGIRSPARWPKARRHGPSG